MLTPVTSDGSRSGVNGRRSKPQLSERASDFASIVLPTPGTSSIRMWPRLSSAITHSSISAALPTSTWPTFSTIREPSASTDPFSTCISYFLFDDPVPRSPAFRCWSNALSRLFVTALPQAAAPDKPGGQTPDGTATEYEYVIDDQAQRVQAGGPQRSHRTDRPGELRHHDEADGHDDAIPGGSPDRSDHAGQEPPGQQRPEGEQPL